MNANEFLALVAPAGVTQSVAFSVSGGNLTRRHSGNVLFEYAGCTMQDILGYANGNRVIALQRVFKPMTDDECAAMLRNPLKIRAAVAGQKVLTEAEQIASLVRAGMRPELAKLAVTNPTKFEELVASLSASLK